PAGRGRQGDRARRPARLRGAPDRPLAALPPAARLPLADVVRTGEPLFISSRAERDARYPGLANVDEDSHALVVLPLVAEGRPVGGIRLSLGQDIVFDEDRQSFKRTLARQASLALERARLLETERALRQRIAFLGEASVILSSSLDYEQTLAQLAALCVPRLA